MNAAGSSAPRRGGLLPLSLALSAAAFLGLEIYELALWMIVKGRPVNIAQAQKFVHIWIAFSALAASAFGALALARRGAAIRGAIAALRPEGAARHAWPAAALFAFLVILAHILPDPRSPVMTLFRAAQGLTALWLTASLAAWLYGRLSLRPALAPMTHPLVNRLWAGLLPLFVFALGVVFMRGVWDRIPHIIDETSYLFQAWMFAQGRVWLPAPPLGEFLDVEFIGRMGGKWFGLYPPGWPVALAPFAALRIEWLANPLFGAAAIYLLVQLLKEERLDPWLWVIVPLIAMSPEVLMESGTFMNENLVLAANLIAVLMLLRAGDRRGRRRRLLIAGAAAGVVFSTRYLDGLCLMALLAMLLLQVPGLGWSARARGALLISAPFALFAAANLAYNRAITGQWFLTPFKFYTDTAYGPDYTRLGFGPNLGRHLESSLAPGHSPLEALYNAQMNLQTLNRTLWGWIGGSLVPVFAFLAFGRMTRRDWTYLGFAASYLTVYALWWYHGVGLGARYYYPLLFIWAVWTLKAARWLAEEVMPRVWERGARELNVRENGVAGGTPAPRGEWDARQGRLAVAAIVMAGQAMALLFTWPVLGAFFFNFLGVTRDVADAVSAKGVAPAVVFLDEGPPGTPPIYQYYFLLNRPRAVDSSGAPADAARAGDVWFDAPVIYLRDRGPAENEQWRALIPGRRLFLYRAGRLHDLAPPVASDNTISAQ